VDKILVFLIVFIAAYAGVEIFRRWSHRRKIFDVPNERSSHTTPTPRGGGIIIVLVCLIFYTINTNFVSHNFSWSYLLGATLVALVSWLDDVFDISFVWRILVHCAAALLVILTLGFFEEIYLPLAGKTEFGFFGAILTFFWIVWLTNAYNFMDGIDGIAGMQAITAGIGWLIVGEHLGFNEIGFYGGVIACSSLGFLIHNWQPAKIFMGDVGSAFLGYSFAVLPLLAKNKSSDNYPLLPVIAVGLVFLFVSDTLITFFGRILKGERIWQAHRRHLYQRFVIKGFSHRFVTLFYSFISFIFIGIIIFWLKTRS
jgi:UDP-N-acetylmuramyl pentapeptide phosphotransferase/UDP-N-acetylglucosamine-1-phosphate transferase